MNRGDFYEGSTKSRDWGPGPCAASCMRAGLYVLRGARGCGRQGRGKKGNGGRLREGEGDDILSALSAPALMLCAGGTLLLRRKTLRPLAARATTATTSSCAGTSQGRMAGTTRLDLKTRTRLRTRVRTNRSNYSTASSSRTRGQAP